jgi:hypothetical protein
MSVTPATGQRVLIHGHLWLGTTQENTADRNRKNRQAKWEANGQAKLKVDDVLLIRRLKKTEGLTDVRLAALFNVSNTLIGKIVRGLIWRGL